jgi:hypothetical protein
MSFATVFGFLGRLWRLRVVMLQRSKRRSLGKVFIVVASEVVGAAVGIRHGGRFTAHVFIC